MKRLKKLIPDWSILVAFNFRCLLRRWRLGRKMPFRGISNLPAVIIAPHPDDETFGCGALISLKRQARVPVRIVFLTSGESVESGSQDKPETIIRVRQAQAVAACKHLGVETADVRWLNLPDGSLPRSNQAGFDEALRKVSAELNGFPAGEIYCPHPNDMHRDHEAAAELVAQTVRLSGKPWRLIHYPIWLWYHASTGLSKRLVVNEAWRIDGRGVKARKDAALSEYLDAPQKAASGNPYCGKLPWGFLWNFRNASEVFFEDPASNQAQTASISNAFFKERLKVLFVSPSGQVYGSEQSLLGLLGSCQFQAEVVCPGGGSLVASLRSLGIQSYALEFNKYAIGKRPDWHFAFYRRFRRILKASQPDVVVINLDGNAPLVTLAAVGTGIPIVRFSRFEFKPPARWIDRWCWHKAAAVICPSERVKRQVLDWAPPEFSERVHRFYEASTCQKAAPEAAAAFRQKLGLGKDRIIGCVGRLHRGKRIETAVKALAEVRKQAGNVQLLIIGGDDGSPNERAYKAELQQLADTLGVSESVIFTGYFPAAEMPTAIAAFDVCVLPSESESFGMVLMEAWAQGVPTVASNAGGCSEITLASGGGLLHPVGDHHVLSQHILKLLSDPALARLHGLAGEAWVKANCDPAAYAERFQNLLQQLRS